MRQALRPGPASPRRGPLASTHRTATAARADLAAWLEAGRVRATGTHERPWQHHAGYREAFA